MGQRRQSPGASNASARHSQSPLAASAPLRALVSPTRPPCGLTQLLRGGWAGIPPELLQGRPTCFGSKSCLKNRATHTAGAPRRGGQNASQRQPWPRVMGREVSSPVSRAPLPQLRLPGTCLSHPPALRFGASFARGGWEHLRNCNNGGQRALAATGAFRARQRWPRRPSCIEEASWCLTARRS